MNYYLEKMIRKVLDLKKRFFKWTTKSLTRMITVIIVMFILLMALICVKDNIMEYEYLIIPITYTYLNR